MKKEKEKPEEIGEPVKIVFYCKDCEKIVKAKKASSRKYIFTCPECKGKNVAFGTEKSITNHYRIKEAEEEQESEK